MSLLDFLFPKRCVNCRKIGEYVCVNCFSKLSFANSHVCLVCGNPSLDGLTHRSCRRKFSIDGVFYGLSYKGVTKKLIYSLKYSPYVSDLAGFLIDLLYESLIQEEAFMHVLQTSKPIFIPIPLSNKKLRKRGYNQAEILAKKLAEKFNFASENLLTRSKDTKPQFGLTKEERRENMHGAFAITQKYNNEKLPNMAILVDDVLTTGSTLLEAAKTLKSNRFSKVYGVCFAYDQ